mgnify:CR=1 FL=1
MGIYLNPDNEGFREAIDSEIYAPYSSKSSVITFKLIFPIISCMSYVPLKKFCIFRKITMGIYLNPDNEGFREAIDSEIYVDKSELLTYTNKVKITKKIQVFCVSLFCHLFFSENAVPFINDKYEFFFLFTINLTPYYSKGCDSKALFENKKIAASASYREHFCNKYIQIQYGQLLKAIFSSILLSKVICFYF